MTQDQFLEKENTRAPSHQLERTQFYEKHVTQRETEFSFILRFICSRLVLQFTRQRSRIRRHLLLDVTHLDHSDLRGVQPGSWANFLVFVRGHAPGRAEDLGRLDGGRIRMADLDDGHPHFRRDDHIPGQHQSYVAVRGHMLADRPVLRHRGQRQHREKFDRDTG